MQLQEVQIELAGICNATCVYCTWEKRTVGKKMMNKDLAVRILKESKELGVTVIRYHGLGESLLHPNLCEIIALGEELGFDHSISTNCFNLKGELAKNLRGFRNLGLILAIPWVMHDKFVDICVKNALDYIESPFEHHKLHVQMVCHEDAEKYYERFVNTFLPAVEKAPNAYLHIKQPVTWPNDSPNKGFIRMDLANHPKVIHDTRQTPVSIGQGCSMPNRFLMVLADGTCVPCCVGMTEEWGLGSVENKPLSEVWNSARMYAIRNLWELREGNIPCTHCQNRTDCLT